MPPPPLCSPQLTELRKTWCKLEKTIPSLLPNSALLMPDHPTRAHSSTTSSAPTSAPAMTATSTPAAPATPVTSSAGTPRGTPVVAAALGVSRRTHPKSRTGCQTCKIRKIKCDEEHPSCRNCIKHGVKCPYTAPTSSAPTPVGAMSTTASPVTLSSMLPPGLSPCLGIHGDHELNLVDLELLHNWSTATYATLSSDTLVRDVWRITVVKLGVQCDYVMRSILAVSALHIAHHRPEKRDFYYSRALTYHQMASRTATPLLSSLATSSDGWEYLYLFSTLTIFFSLGSTKQSDMIHNDSFPPWIYLLSGTRSLVRLAWIRIDDYQGPLAPLFRHGRRRWELYNLEHTVIMPPELTELQERIIRSVPDPLTRNIYLAAVDDLARNIKVFSMSDMQFIPDITDAFVWVFADLDPFLAQLRAQTQESVAVLAHFGVMIRQLENQWWLEGWSFLLLAKAWDVLDDEHKLWVQWPIEQVGWIPP